MKNKPRLLIKPVYYSMEEIEKIYCDSFTFVFSPRYRGKITYLKRKQTKNKTPR